MDDREIFSTPCWNFIGGDRQIERILRELPPGQGLVVRNRLANVLATVAGLADLRQEDGSRLPLRVNVPENAVYERALPMETPVDGLETLLTRLYGIRVEMPDAPEPESVLLAVGFTPGADAAALAAWLADHPALPVVFLNPPGAPLAPELCPFAVDAWSAQTGAGLNAFSYPTVEEAVAELAPQVVYVAAATPEVAAYTAIGAVDYFIREAAAVEPLDGRRILQLGGRVRVLRPSVPAGAPTPLRDWLRDHLQALGVASTGPDGRFSATAEAIAIDIA